jgi:hypothetical protein
VYQASRSRIGSLDDQCAVEGGQARAAHRGPPNLARADLAATRYRIDAMLDDQRRSATSDLVSIATFWRNFQTCVGSVSSHRTNPMRQAGG